MIKLHSTITGVAVAGAVAIGSTAALADGVPTRAPRAVVEAPFSWTGFYIGASAGIHAIDDAHATISPANAATVADLGAGLIANGSLPTRYNVDGSGAIGGLNLGYNWQFGSFLLGFEADISGSTASASQQNDITKPPFVRTISTYIADVDWLGTVRARLGLLVSPTFLAYATGGYAYGHAHQKFTGALLAQGGNFTQGLFSDVLTGWTAGGGAEWAITNRVTVRAEYLFVRLDGESFVSTTVSPTCAGAASCTLNVRTSDIDNHIGRLGVNFKF